MTRVESPAERRSRLVDSHAYNGLALLTLYDGWRYFEPPGIDAFVAFELHGGTAVACGDPVCAETDVAEVLSRFAVHCDEYGWRLAFVGASARAGKVAAELGLHVVKIGEEPFLDLGCHNLSGRAAKKARSAINQARRSGIAVQEYRDQTPAVDAEIEEVARQWLDARNVPPMGFLLRSRVLAQREHKRIFVGSHAGRVVAVMTCARAPARGLWYVEEQLRRPDAPYGTSELLIEEARTTAAGEGVALFSLGTAPLQRTTEQPYGRFRLLKALFWALTLKINFVYSFRSLNHFKKKFAPSFWEDNFFIYRGALPLTAASVIMAFAPDGIPALVLPRRMQWLRLVPSAALWTAAGAGVLFTGFAAWQFPAMTLPVRLVIDSMRLALLPADEAFDRAHVAVMGHRVVASVVLIALGAVAWRRRARA